LDEQQYPPFAWNVGDLDRLILDYLMGGPNGGSAETIGTGIRRTTA